MNNQRFLKTLAIKVLSEYNGDPDSLIVVLPSRRAALYFKKEIIELIDKPLFAPTIIPIGDFIKQFSGLDIADELSLLISLFDVYKSVMPNNAQDFNSFFPSGRLLIKDFNDIDDNLIEGNQLFDNLADIKEIEGWEPGIIEGTSQKNYLEFFRKIAAIYTKFRETLIKKGEAYSGLASLTLYKQRQEAFGGRYSESKFVIAGLNALSPSESGIFGYLYDKGRLSFAWDCDTWYMDDPNHEAGIYLRANKKQWPSSFGPISSQLATASKNIRFIGAPQRYEQIQAALESMSRIPEHEWSESALILADETLAPIFMESVPHEMESKMNISLGFPLSQTIAASWVDDWINLQENMLRTSESAEYNYKIMMSRRNLLRLLSNPLSPIIAENKPEKVKLLNQCLVFLRNSAQFYFQLQQTDQIDYTVINGKNICAIINELIPDLLIPVKGFQNASHKLYDLYSAFSDPENNQSEEDIEQVACGEICIIASALMQINIPEDENRGNQLSILKLLLKDFMRQTRIRLHGEPVKGLQVIGMLETRALDFKNIIIVGANEGILPAGKTQQSFIPYDLRKQSGLPTFEKNDAVFAYHFYRLLQSSTHIDIIYNTETDPLTGKEPSRFLHQINHLLCKTNNSINLEQLICGVAIPSFDQVQNQIINKDSFIIKRLNEIASKGLSFSAFYNYLSCPLKFYYSSIMRIREVEDFGDVIKINQLGTLVHQILETLYLDSCGTGKIPNQDTLETMKSRVDFEFDKQAAILHEGIDFDLGENYLLKKVLTEAIKRYIAGQLEDSKNGIEIPEVLEMEMTHSHAIQLRSKKEILLSGKIDRIERKANTRFIIDYKTTNKALKHLKLNLDREFSDDIDNIDQYIMQLMYYSFIYYKEVKPKEPVMAGLYPLLGQKNHAVNILSQKIKMQDANPIIFSDELITVIEQTIINVLEPLFDNEAPISPKPSVDACKYCIYKDRACFASQQILATE